MTLKRWGLILLLVILTIACGIYVTQRCRESFLRKEGIEALHQKAFSGYYDAASRASDEDLKAVLHDLVKNHRVLRDKELWNALRDLDMGDEGKVVLFYGRGQRDADKKGGARGDWNREHLWPRAYGVKLSEVAKRDLHHIRATDVGVNGARGHLYFDETDGEDFGGERYSRDADSWEPPNEVKGDIARALFYMAVCYENPDLELSDHPKLRSNLMGKLSVLLKWHEEDPVSEEERVRNAKIYQIYQGNRNPFIDHPEYVQRVFKH